MGGMPPVGLGFLAGYLMSNIEPTVEVWTITAMLMMEEQG